MNDDSKMHDGRGAPSSAVSLFGGDSYAGDFPVLKAFQEYINEEQAKARKRMLGLSIFFIVLLVVVVVTFVLALTFMIKQNQSLSDRLLDMAFKQPGQQVQSSQQQPAQNVVQPASTRVVPAVQSMPAPKVEPAPQASQNSDFKPVLEKMEKLAAALTEATKANQQSAHPVVQPAVVVQPVQHPASAAQQAVPPPAEKPVPKALVSEEERVREQIRRQREELKKLKQETDAEKERLRKEEVERQRRKLYPEHYAREDARKEAEKRLEAVKPVSYFGNSDDEDDDLAEVARLAKEAREKEAERKRIEAEVTAKLKAEAEAAAKRKAEAEAAAKRKAEAAAERKAKAEAAAKRKAEAAAAARRKAEAERKAAEEAARAQAEEIEIGTDDDSTVPLLIPNVD